LNLRKLDVLIALYIYNFIDSQSSFRFTKKLELSVIRQMIYILIASS